MKECVGASALATVAAKLSHLIPIKPLSHQQKTFVQEHKCFLLRNLEKVKQLREKLKQAVRGGGHIPLSETDKAGVVNQNSNPSVKQSDVFLTQLNALSCPRSIRTRRLAQAEDNPEMTKTARLACIFKHLYSTVATAKGNLVHFFLVDSYFYIL
jgi:histone-lysine N-methyltransferase ASH1L